MEGTPAFRIEGETIVESFCVNLRRIGARPALRRRAEKGWETLTWGDYGRAVAEVTAGLAEMGVDAGDRVAILSGNRVEWHLADFGTLCNGSVTVPLYPTSSAEQVHYLLQHCRAVLCFVENHDLLAKVLEVRDRLPELRQVVVFDNDERIDDPSLIGLEQLRSIGATRLEREPDLFDSRAAAVVPEQLATLVYTSGTTGPPKGAMVSHANIIWTIRSAAALFEFRERERLLSFLPLSHIAERMMSDFTPVAIGGETWFARSLATVAEDLRDCRPTLFFAVPRVWEKAQEAILEKFGDEHGLRRLVIERYIDLGEHVISQHATAHDAPIWERLPYTALDAAVGARIRGEMGLDKAHILITAAAPTHPDLIRWYHSIGIPIVELYGQTESCGPTTANPPHANHVGTVGLPFPGVRVSIAPDGEILVKGGNVCMGYFENTEGTVALFDDDGWMRSGDTGSLDDDGYLTITGRKKDLIITAAGQNIAPQEIEMDLRYAELVSEAMVIGEGRRYLTALITLDADALKRWADMNGKIADYEALVGDPDLRDEVARIVAEVNRKRSRVENIRKYRLLPHQLTVAEGEMTPTLKVKRNVVADHYRSLIDEMYAEETVPA
ncbi:MAG TPA: long-chain fatty acid--CoA ligase [Acidimicrobiia bacterium]